MVLSACTRVATTEPTSGDPLPGGVTKLDISPGVLLNGKVGVAYEFTMEASGIPSGVPVVAFQYSFVDGSNGQRAVRVVDGKASFTVSQSYSSAGVYGLIASVAQPLPRNAFKVLAADRVIIAIETDPVREQELPTCGGWATANSGGYGGTIDIWNISNVPAGAVFDLRYNTYQIPDMFVVEYDGVETYESGWRGLPRYDGDILYPGGVIGIGQGVAEAVFTKADADEFQVTVFGPDQRTLWEYGIRCRIPAE